MQLITTPRTFGQKYARMIPLVLSVGVRRKASCLHRCSTRRGRRDTPVWAQHFHVMTSPPPPPLTISTYFPCSAKHFAEGTPLRLRGDSSSTWVVKKLLERYGS